MPTVKEYLDLITSEHRDRPRFQAMVEAVVSLPVRIQALMQAMIPLFDVDVAVGQQLDIIGQWVGITRNVNIPVAGIYFSWDGALTQGWDFGSWAPPSAPSVITSLPDDAYRTLIKAKIAANSWDGTTTGAYEVWDTIFTTVNLLIIDHQDMSYDVALVGAIVDSLTLALLTGGYIPLKPEGVRVNAYFVPVNDGPLFAWDLDTESLQGWDEGSWVRIITP